MSILKTGVSAIGKLALVAVLAATFLVGAVGAVWLSLRGEVVTVPEITGKDFSQSETELAELGLKIKKRATRYSSEKPNTVIEQSPKAGDTMKTGNTILVVIAEPNPEGTEAPATIKKDDNSNDTEDDTDDLINDKPKNSNKPANKKPIISTRDVLSNKTNKNANVNAATGNVKTSSNTSTPGNPANKITSPPPVVKPSPNAANKPAAAKTPTSGDTRNRRIP